LEDTRHNDELSTYDINIYTT